MFWGKKFGQFPDHLGKTWTTPRKLGRQSKENSERFRRLHKETLKKFGSLSPKHEKGKVMTKKRSSTESDQKLELPALKN